MAIGIIYGSSGGTTQSIAEMIQTQLGVESHLHDISMIGINELTEYSHLIIGTSTWGNGDLQDDWDEVLEEYKDIKFEGITMAFFGTGDQDGYGENFLDGMGTLHEVAVNNGALIVGNKWSTDGYDFEDSTAIHENTFVGLAIDEDNQDDMTEKRVETWIESIKPYFI